jgi:hypothetical protein
MKCLSVFDYIYYCVYKIIMKSPSRTQPHVSSIVFLAIMIVIHALFLFLWIKALVGIDVEHSTVKIIILLSTFFSIAVLAYYYDWKKRGERVIKYYADKIGERKSVVIGYIIFFETLFFPFIIWGLLYLWQKWT